MKFFILAILTFFLNFIEPVHANNVFQENELDKDKKVICLSVEQSEKTVDKLYSIYYHAKSGAKILKLADANDTYWDSDQDAVGETNVTFGDLGITLYSSTEFTEKNLKGFFILFELSSKSKLKISDVEGGFQVEAEK